MKLIAFVLALALCVLAVACGDDEAPPAATASPQGSDGLPTGTATVPPNAEPGTPLPPDIDVTPQAPRGSTNPHTIAVQPDPNKFPVTLVDVRVGGHPEDGGFDRIVFEFDGAQPGGLIEYRDEVEQCGSGMPVDPEGSATLLVHFVDTNAHTETGELSVLAIDLVGPGTSILAAESICDFEAVVEWAVGVDGEKPFTVTLLENPTRVVIDVAH
jgi:hypothetical protein